MTPFLRCERRESRRATAEGAPFPAAKLLDEFDSAARPSVNKPLGSGTAAGEYLDRRENILLVGTERHGEVASGDESGNGGLCARPQGPVLPGD